MKPLIAITRRELLGLSKTPTALLFLLVFSGLSNLVVLGQERIFDRGQADLAPLFSALPWLALALLPALSMGLFSEERRAGSIELLLTLPVTCGQVVVGKFLAALTFASLALVGTTPIWLAISNFGAPDHMAILAAYAGALLLFSALLAIGSFVSALTRSPAAAFVSGVTLGFLFLFSDVPAVAAALPDVLVAPAASLSFASRYEALARGVLGLDDLLFFLATSAAFLAATRAVLIGRRQGRSPLAACALFFFGLSAFALVAAPLARGLRLDFTAGQLYSLSPATKSIAADLSSPLIFDLYLAEEAAATSPRFMGFTKFVQQQLADLARSSGGQITVNHHDAAPFSEADDAAQTAKLLRLPLGVDGGGRELVFGLVAHNLGGDQRTLSFISPENEAGLEHLLARLIVELSNPERRRIGVVTSFQDGVAPGHPLTGGLAERGWQVVSGTRAEYEYQALNTPLSAVPEDIDVLWLLHPKGLDGMTIKAIDRFAQSGGALLIHIDPLMEADMTGMDPGDARQGYVAQRDSNCADLLSAWGVEMIKRRVLGDRSLGLELPAGAVDNAQPVTYPHWLGLRPGSFETGAHAAPLFAGLQGINFASAGTLEVQPRTGLEARALLNTSADSMRIQASQVQVIKDPASLMRDFVSSGQSENFGIELIGMAPAAIPGNEVANPAPMRAYIIADVDCASDSLWIQESPGEGFRAVADNGIFFARLLAELAGGAPLGLASARRSGALYTRPFTKLDDLDQAAEERLARELSAARALEDELTKALFASAEDPTAIALQASAEELTAQRAAARQDLKRLLRERSAESDASKRRATRWCLFGWPALLVLAALRRLGARRRSA